MEIRHLYFKKQGGEIGGMDKAKTGTIDALPN